MDYMDFLVSEVLSTLTQRYHICKGGVTESISSTFPLVFSEARLLLLDNDPSSLLVTLVTFILTAAFLTFAQFNARRALSYLIGFNWFNQNNVVRIILILFPSVHSLDRSNSGTGSGGVGGAKKGRRKSSHGRRESSGPHSPQSILLTPAKKFRDQLRSKRGSRDIFEPEHALVDRLLVLLSSLKFSVGLPDLIGGGVNMLLTIVVSYR